MCFCWFTEEVTVNVQFLDADCLILLEVVIIVDEDSFALHNHNFIVWNNPAIMHFFDIWKFVLGILCRNFPICIILQLELDEFGSQILTVGGC